MPKLKIELTIGKLSEKQIESVSCIVKQLLKEFNLTTSDILVHENIQQKTAGEGQVVRDAIAQKIK